MIFAKSTLQVKKWIFDRKIHTVFLIILYPLAFCWKSGYVIKKKKNQGRLKKTEFFNSPNSQYFFEKIWGIDPWVSRINWCEGHWCGSIYMAMRLSDISSKTGKKCIFCVFRLFLSLHRTASWPYRLSHTSHQSILHFQGPIPEIFAKKKY